MHYEKIYLETLVRFTEDGRMLPESFVWNGLVISVDKVIDSKKAPPEHTGAFLTHKFICLINGKARNLYFESRTFRWFAEARCSDERG